MHSSAFVAESISIFQMAQYRLNHLLFSRWHSTDSIIFFTSSECFKYHRTVLKLILTSSFLFKHLEPYNIDMCITTVLTMWSPKSTYKFSALSGIHFLMVFEKNNLHWCFGNCGEQFSSTDLSVGGKLANRHLIAHWHIMNKLATGYQLALQELHIFLGSFSSQLPIVFFFLNVFLDENVLIPLGEIPI